jgi:hypothetical protein
MLEEFGNRLVQLADSEEANSGATKALTRKVGHFLIALAAFLERVGQRLEHYGNALIDEAKIAAETSRSR